MLDEHKTIGRYPAKATLNKLADAQKSFADGAFGAFGPFLGSYSGGVGRNADIAYNKYGAANAYRLVPPINRAVNLRADAHDSLPWKIIRNATNDPKNDVIVAKSSDNHPAHPFAEVLQKLYHRQKASLFWLMEYADLVYGEIFIEYLKNESEFVRGLKWLNPLAVVIETRDGEIYRYLYSDLNGEAYIPLNRDEVAYDRFLNPVDDWRGLSRVNVAVEKINIYRNVNRTTEAKFRNMARPDVVVSPPDSETSWTDIERNKIRDEMRRNFQGSDNAGSAMVAPRSLKIDTFEQANIEEQYQINDPVRKEIYEEFGVPLSMAGDNTGTTYQSNDATLTWFYQNTVIPAAKKRQFFVNTELLIYFDPYGDSRFEFDTSAYDLVSADDKTRADVAASNYSKSIWTFNQSRVYTKESPLGTVDYLSIEGIPVPLDQVSEYWKYKLLVKPAPQEAGVVGTELQVDTPKQGQEITAQAGSGGSSFGKALESGLIGGMDKAKDSDKTTLTVIEGKAFQSDAESELKAWERKLSKNPKATFEPHHLKVGVGQWLAHELEHAGGEAGAIKALFTTARDVLIDSGAWDDNALNMLDKALRSIKSYDDTEEAFYSEVLGLIHAGQQDEVSRGKFAGGFRRSLRVNGLQAFRDGMQDAGYDPESFSPEDLKVFRDWQSEQSGYVTNLGAEVFKQGITEPEVEIRARMWTDISLRQIYLLGVAQGQPHKKYKWELQPEAMHCKDCPQLDGQVHTIKEWLDSGILPGSGMTECQQGCKCGLVETDEPINGAFLIQHDLRATV